MRYRFFMALIFLTGMIAPISMEAQLFPKLDEIQGKVLRIEEKHYGRKVFHFLGLGIFPYKFRFKPNAFSGWKYEYYYDEQNKLLKEIRTDRGELVLEYAFSEDTLGGNTFKRETYVKSREEENIGSYTEYEYVMRPNNEVERLNYWYGGTQRDDRYLSTVESDSRYERGLLTHYVRYGVRKDGSTYRSQTYEIYYDSLNRVSLIEEWNDTGYKFKEMQNPLKGTTSELIVDSVSTMSKSWKFGYNSLGQLETYLCEHLKYKEFKNLDFYKYEMFYEYDLQGNWIKSYIKYDDGERRLETKRKIKYKK